MNRGLLGSSNFASREWRFRRMETPSGVIFVFWRSSWRFLALRTSARTLWLPGRMTWPSGSFRVYRQ
jgi:hypothetical protein